MTSYLFPFLSIDFTMRAAMIVVVSSAAVIILFHIVHYLYSLKLNFDLKNSSPLILKNYPFVSIHLPIRSEPIDLVKQFIENIKKINYPPSAFELLILSDDDENYIQDVRELVKEYVESGLNIKVLSRDSIRGFKAGALNHLLRESRGEYIVVFDVDSNPPSNFLIKVINYLESNKEFDALTVKWKPHNILNTPISEAQATSLNFLSKVLFDGREVMNGPIFLTGNGCVIRKRVLEDIGGWPEDTLIEDVDLSIKLLVKGRRIKYLHEVELPIEIPETYHALKKQQIRWVYGATQVFMNNFWNVIRSNISLKWKLEILLHIIQYHALLLNIALIIFALLSLVLGFDVLLINMYYLVFLLPFISIYAIIYYHSSCSVIASSKKRIVNIGRSAAVTGSLAPAVFISSLKAILRLKELWHVTPKGKFLNKSKSVGKLEIMLSAICYPASIVLFIKGYILSALCLVVFGLPCLYVLIRTLSNKW